MRVCALASGSKGNCFYVEKGNSAVLVDAGISAKKIVERMSLLNLDAEKIKAIFVTHEHSDHIKGIDVFSRRFNVPVFATKGTIANGFLCSNREMINPIKKNERVEIGGLGIEAFSKSHRAAEPVSYSIIDRNKVVSIITDVGCACENTNEKISKSDFLFLESNHDKKMLENGPYPYFLKKWIVSDSGHLSNKQAGLAVLENGNKKLKNVVLSHLSRTNNLPEVALKTFENLVRERSDFNAQISVSLDSAPTGLFNV